MIKLQMYVHVLIISESAPTRCFTFDLLQCPSHPIATTILCLYRVAGPFSLFCIASLKVQTPKDWNRSLAGVWSHLELDARFKSDLVIIWIICDYYSVVNKALARLSVLGLSLFSSLSNFKGQELFNFAPIAFFSRVAGRSLGVFGPQQSSLA